MSSSVATPWESFDPRDNALPVGLLGSILGHTADAFLIIEPVRGEPPKKRLFGKAPASEYQVVVTPYATSDPPEIMIYVTFPKGDKFSARTSFTLPAWAELSDDDRDSAMIDMSIIQRPADVIALAIAALRATTTEPLGDEWRTSIADTHVAYGNY